MNMLNFACGSVIHPQWENIDFSPIDNRVKKVNLLATLPYPDNFFDYAYSSHFLEHLTRHNATKVLSEIKRIVKPNAIVRIVVPDLENICKTYLTTLQEIRTMTTRGGGYCTACFRALLANVRDA